MIITAVLILWLSLVRLNLFVLTLVQLISRLFKKNSDELLKVYAGRSLDLFSSYRLLSFSPQCKRADEDFSILYGFSSSSLAIRTYMNIWCLLLFEFLDEILLLKFYL